MKFLVYAILIFIVFDLLIIWSVCRMPSGFDEQPLGESIAEDRRDVAYQGLASPHSDRKQSRSPYPEAEGAGAKTQ